MSDVEMSDLLKRVKQFQMLALPGQPQSMHMGTNYLVRDLAARVRELEAEAVIDETAMGNFLQRAEKVEAERQELMDALEKSVSLQSHFANLLNMDDGGKRIVFKSADEWLARLRSLAKRMQTPVPAAS